MSAGEYESTLVVESRTRPGVTLTFERVSFGRRLELAKRARELGRRIDFDRASETAEGSLAAAIAQAEIDRMFLDWGLRAVSGLVIDGEPATPQTLVERGPEDLCREAVAHIKRECGLTEEERKN